MHQMPDIRYRKHPRPGSGVFMAEYRYVILEQLLYAGVKLFFVLIDG
jgi:hypothetical protein